MHEDDAAIARWVEAARRGETEAFGEIVRTLSPSLRRQLHGRVNDGPALDDLVQDAFVRAWERLDGFDPARPFAPWLSRIAANMAVDRHRKRLVRSEVDDGEPWLESISVPATAASQVENEELLEIVDELLLDLPEGWAEVIRLRAADELSTAEIAAQLGIPLGTVLSRLARARARLALRLAERLGERRRSGAGLEESS